MESNHIGPLSEGCATTTPNQVKKNQIFKDPNGAKGIRTPGGFIHFGFQDRHNKPLCHCSSGSGENRTPDVYPMGPVLQTGATQMPTVASLPK